MSKSIQESKKIDADQLKQKAQNLLTHFSGYISTRVMEIGKKKGIFDEISDYPSGIDAATLAENLDYDKEYLQVWLDAAYSFELVEENDDQYTLAEYIEPLILNKDFSNYIGAFPGLFTKEEVFDNFETHLESGKRVWWDEVSEGWIKQVSESTYSLYTRMLNKGFSKVPGFDEKMSKKSTFMEMASGAGVGLARIIKKFPNNDFVGLDGDEYSIGLAEKKMKEEGLENKTKFIHSSFEEMDVENEFDVVFINASMHECRDLDKVTSNVYNALNEDGIFIISDLPFPESRDEYRKLPSQIMLGVNFFEAQIDDLLLPTQDYVDLLNKHGFDDVGSFNLNPTHCVVYGYKK